MELKTGLRRIHPMGETKRKAASSQKDRIAIDTFGGRIHVEWDPDGAVTPLGQLPFFIEFLKVSGLFDSCVEECPLEYLSPNAPDKRDVIGTLLLSILSGHKRYAHIATIRCDGVNPELLGMNKVISEDAARRALSAIEEKSGIEWLGHQLTHCTGPLLSFPWILDCDTTIKPLYGKQEGAVVGYNPKKPGRPSHAYHSYFMANTRLALTVDVEPGNKSAAIYSTETLFKWLSDTPVSHWPAFVRGDCAYGTEPMLIRFESIGLPYLTKLRLTSGVKRLIDRLFIRTEWIGAGQGWEGTEDTLMLSGWSKSRRVIILRRLLRGEIALEDGSADNTQQLLFIETGDTVKKYEYAILVTTLSDEILTIAQHYRDRADCENIFDELKNQWGWGGYTTKDMKRCRISARLVALVYNWWNLFVRLANPDKHNEAITSRPLLLHAVAKQTKHGGQTTLTITSSHSKREYVQAALTRLAGFLCTIKNIAEQLSVEQRCMLILKQAYSKLLLNWSNECLKYLPAPA
jgi:Transposase DDE domain group 1